MRYRNAGSVGTKICQHITTSVRMWRAWSTCGEVIERDLCLIPECRWRCRAKLSRYGCGVVINAPAAVFARFIISRSTPILAAK
ncbi:hypothetical protein KCP74_08985 [Salmonella enterica subsp. enterica]|nr:hypothetical protein KCP74_08985 [Salmonella enterica subsp. enterica]